MPEAGAVEKERNWHKKHKLLSKGMSSNRKCQTSNGEITRVD